MSDNENLGSSVDGDVNLENYSNNAEDEGTYDDVQHDPVALQEPENNVNQLDKSTNVETSEPTCTLPGVSEIDNNDVVKSENTDDGVITEKSEEEKTKTEICEVEQKDIDDKEESKLTDDCDNQCISEDIISKSSSDMINIVKDIEQEPEHNITKDAILDTEAMQNVVEETKEMILDDSCEKSNVDSVNSNKYETDCVLPSDGKTDEKLTDKPAEISDEREKKSEDNEDKSKEKKIDEKEKNVKKSDSSKKPAFDQSSGKRFDKKDKGTPKKSEECSNTRDSPSRTQSGRQELSRSKVDSRSSAGGRGDAKSYKKEEERYDQKKKTTERDDRGKRYEEKDSKRYSDRRDRERSYRDDKAKRFDDKDKRKDDRNGRRGSGDSKSK